MGSPAKIIRELTTKEKESIRESAGHYAKISRLYIK
jgi:carbonic anhydrase/acetyltransferase-like protein (isoleucine patch superfamily)